MFREDILWFIPAISIALLQVKIIWRSLPAPEQSDTKKEGVYSDLDRALFTYWQYGAYFLFWIQLVFPLFIITESSQMIILLRLLGYGMIILGFLASYSALKRLDRNWTGLDEYRIKNGQQLVMTGIYKIVRHPIYLAVILEIVGFELVATSWLWIILLAVVFYVINQHIRKEDLLLEEEFGEKFLEYKKRTKALVPYLY